MSLGLKLVNGDLAWSSGALVQLTDPLDTLRQLLECRLRMAVGEWFLDLDDGLDIYGSILGKPRSESVIRQVMRDRILGTPGVKAILSMAVSLEARTRQLTIDYRAQASPGILTGTLTLS